jgi:hypothetical protein
MRHERGVTVLRKIYESIGAERHGITWHAFRAHFKGWKIHPLVSCGSNAGAVVQRGPEVHIVFFSQPKGSIRAHLIGHLQRTIDEFGFADTFVEIGNEKSRVFCERLGFVPTGVKGNSISMRCTQFAYSRQK